MESTVPIESFPEPQEHQHRTTSSCDKPHEDPGVPIPEVKFEDIVIASGDEAIKLSRALERSKEEGARVVQEIIDTEGCDPERAWLLKVFLAVLERSGDPVALQERSRQG